MEGTSGICVEGGEEPTHGAAFVLFKYLITNSSIRVAEVKINDGVEVIKAEDDAIAINRMVGSELCRIWT